jgi:hypothetical protein
MRSQIFRSLPFLLCLFAATCILPPSHAQTPAPPAQTQSVAASQFPPPSAAEPVQPISLSAQPATGKAPANHKANATVSVGNGDWQATGIQLIPGDQVTFQATGNMTLSDGNSVTPSGAARGWRDLLRIYPLNSANSGSLIGRIGNGAAALPFPIGDKATLSAPSEGELYLRANLSSDLSATGNFTVKVSVQPPKAGDAAASQEASKSFAAKLSPALFESIPRRVTDQTGNLGDMVNFSLVGTEQQVKADLTKAGWFPTDANPTDAVLNGLLATLGRKSYMAVPMSTLYLFGRPQDLAYARAEAITVAATRNHMRLWKTNETVDGLPLWVGSATHDNGFEKDQRTGGVTHHIDPDIDQERDFIVSSFISAGAAKAAAFVTPSNPVGAAKTATGGSFHSDGRIAVILLK